jgi:hypothetical protein
LSAARGWPSTPDLGAEAGKGNSCPKCGAAIVPIIYRMPAGELVQQAKRGEVELGGCVVWGDNPQLVCRGPKPHYWRRGDHGQLVT